MKFLAALTTTASLLISSTHAQTISIGHDAIDNYAWTSPSSPCPGTTISHYYSGSSSSLCGHPFTLGTSTYRLSNCGDAANFQLEERAGGDGWVFSSFCYPPDSGDLMIECGGGTEQWVVVETFKCGVPSR